MRTLLTALLAFGAWMALYSYAEPTALEAEQLLELESESDCAAPYGDKQTSAPKCCAFEPVAHPYRLGTSSQRGHLACVPQGMNFTISTSHRGNHP